MDVTCTHCGALNRSTSRFCARCGEALPEQAPEQKKQTGSLELPWLKAVQDHAVKPTEKLTDEELTQATSPEVDVSPAPSDPPTPTEHPAEEEANVTPAPETRVGDAAPAGDEPPPGWVMGILEPEGQPAPRTDQPYEPEELHHIMPWVHPDPSAPAGTGEPPPGDASGLPPWLNGVTVQETLESSGTGLGGAEAAGDVGDLALEGIEPFAPPTEASRTEAESQTIRPKSQELAPAWLRNISGVRAEEQRVADEQSAETAASASAAVHEETGTVAEHVVRNVAVRAPRAGAVETLTALIRPASGDEYGRTVAVATGMLHAIEYTKIAQRRSVGRTIARWLFPDGLIYAAILAVLLTVLLVKLPLGATDTPAAKDVQNFYNAVESVPQSKPVLLVYDWDATRSAEMFSLARAIVHHLMSRKLRFVTISTAPQGPGFAEQSVLEVANNPRSNYGYRYGIDYLILGYLPGSQAGLRAITADLKSAMPLDYVNNERLDNFELIRNSKIAKVDDFALIVELSSEEVDLRSWVEQVGTRTSVPIVAAVPQGLEPLARPFVGVPGAGLQAVVAGPAGALRYTRQLLQAGRASGAINESELEDRLNAQSAAQALVAAIIVAAFAGMAARRVLRR